MASVVAIALTGRVKPDFIFEWAPFILGGVSITIFVSITSIVFATIFAVIGALGRLSRIGPDLRRGDAVRVARPRHAADRPAHLLYLALPQFGIVLAALACGIFALAFNYGAYMTEIFRAGIQAIPRGQRRGGRPRSA